MLNYIDQIHEICKRGLYSIKHAKHLFFPHIHILECFCRDYMQVRRNELFIWIQTYIVSCWWNKTVFSSSSICKRRFYSHNWFTVFSKKAFKRL